MLFCLKFPQGRYYLSPNSKGSVESALMRRITKTCLYNFDPLIPHFYIVKLGFTGVYIIFLISALNIDCGYSLEPPRRGGSNEYPQSMFLSRNMKNIRFFLSENVMFLEVKFSIYLNRRVFVMGSHVPLLVAYVISTIFSYAGSNVTIPAGHINIRKASTYVTAHLTFLQ